MSVDSIVKRILTDASGKAELVVEEAASRADDLLNKAREESGALSSRIIDEARLQAKLDMERAHIAKTLEIKKELLKKKRDIIDRAFTAALRGALAMDDDKYRSFLEKNILKNVKKGEEAQIYFSRTDSERISASFITGLNGRHGLNLRMGPYFEKDDAGFMLKKGNIIIKCTVSEELSGIKNRLMPDISRIIFG